MASHHCECGCGGITPLAPKTDATKGWTVGKPLRFIRWHHLRLTPRALSGAAKRKETHLCECGCGTPTVRSHGGRKRPNLPSGNFHRFTPGHHRRMIPAKAYAVKTMRDGKSMSLHRIRAENALGRPLPDGVVVHHADGSKDVMAQLVICQDQAYHMLLHQRMRIKAAGGDPNRDSSLSEVRQRLALSAR